MAWTERYVRADAAGGGDGTTNTNSGGSGAWTLAEGITNEAAGMRLNVLAGTYANTSTSRTFAATGTTTAPIWWRGFKAAIGDQDANNVAVAGTDIPSWTFTTGQLVASGAHHTFSNIDINGACVTSTGQVNASGTSVKWYRCRVQNTAANSNGLSLSTAAGALVAASYLKSTTTASKCINLAGSESILFGSTVTGGIIGVSLAAVPTHAHFCIFDSQAGDAISLVNTVVSTIIGCGIYNPTGNGIAIAATVGNGTLIANCYFENVNQAAKAAINNTSGTNTNFVHRIANGYFNCTANESGFGDSPIIFDVGTLALAGFVAPGSQNFSLNPFAWGLGFPGKFENISAYQGYISNGAVQPLPGSVVINKILNNFYYDVPEP